MKAMKKSSGVLRAAVQARVLGTPGTDIDVE
jgi:hypothetical protein